MATLTPLPPKNAYIGGGSRDEARKLLIDLAPHIDPPGKVAGCDIVRELINYLYIFRNHYLPAAAAIYQWMPL